MSVGGEGFPDLGAEAGNGLVPSPPCRLWGLCLHWGLGGALFSPLASIWRPTEQGQGGGGSPCLWKPPSGANTAVFLLSQVG